MQPMFSFSFGDLCAAQLVEAPNDVKAAAPPATTTARSRNLRLLMKSFTDVAPAVDRPAALPAHCNRNGSDFRKIKKENRRRFNRRCRRWTQITRIVNGLRLR